MNKNAAATFLQIGLRTLERHTSAGRITAAKIKTPNGPALDYDEAELERFKREVLEPSPQSPPAHLSVVVGVAEPTSDSKSTALVRIKPQVPAWPSDQNIDMVTVPVEVLAKLADVAATVAGREQKPQALLGEKLTLSLDEAAVLSGVPRAVLRAAVADGSLAARKLGRGWRVKRSALDAWIEATC